jgi:hypothetical protein
VPITYHILKDARLIISVHKGEVSNQEFLASYNTYLDDPEFDLEYSRLVDLRDAASQLRSAEALREVISLIRSKYGDKTEGPKTAIVAQKDVSFGLARMFEGFSDRLPGEIRVYRDIHKALEWLDVPFDDAKEIFEEL